MEDTRLGVSQNLIRRFTEWITARTELGTAKYGEPLTTFNNRDAAKDMMEELLDFCQYQEQSRLEALELLRQAQLQIFPLDSVVRVGIGKFLERQWGRTIL